MRRTKAEDQTVQGLLRVYEGRLTMSDLKIEIADGCETRGHAPPGKQTLVRWIEDALPTAFLQIATRNRQKIDAAVALAKKMQAEAPVPTSTQDNSCCSLQAAVTELKEIVAELRTAARAPAQLTVPWNESVHEPRSENDDLLKKCGDLEQSNKVLVARLVKSEFDLAQAEIKQGEVTRAGATILEFAQSLKNWPLATQQLP